MLAGALLVAAVMAVLLDRTGLPGAYVLLVPVLVYAAPLVLALAARLEPGPDRPSTGDLDHLVTLRRAGALPPARRPARRVGGPRPGPGSARPPRPIPPAGALDRLVRRKHEWAGSTGAGPEDEGTERAAVRGGVQA